MSLSFRLRHTSRLWQVGLSLFSMCIIFTCGLLIIILQTEQQITHNMQQRISQAREQMDTTLDHATQAARHAAAYAGQPCTAEVLLALRRLAALTPGIRTVSLAADDYIYCSSLLDTRKSRVNEKTFSHSQLLLMAGNTVAPDLPLIALRFPVAAPDESVLIGINGYYFHNTLNLLSHPTTLVLQVGEHIMTADGVVHAVRPVQTDNVIIASSPHYAYRLLTSQPPGLLWQIILMDSKGSILFMLVLSTGIAAMTYRLLNPRHSPVNALQAGIRNREFVAFAQPLVNGETRALEGCEILMRWQQPEMGMIPPDQFIPLAEQSGLIVPMTHIIMRQVREHFRPLRHQLPAGFHFSFNISAQHCRDTTLLQDCREFIAAFSPLPVQLVLEITERELMVDDSQSAQLLQALHDMGVLIALDDFGTGHSSLNYLQQFRIDILKIDKSFVQRIDSDADSLSNHLIDNVIDLAKRLDLTLIAEGVETESQARYLLAHRIHLLQGYLLGKPTNLPTFAARYLNRVTQAGRAS
jgi:sensor c-di-GMP phosphodiesterase-like protein